METSWSPTTKRTIVIGIVIAGFLLVSQVRVVLSPLAITIILAFILIPIADHLSARARLNRTLVVVFIYLLLLAVIVTVPALLIPPLIDQIRSFTDDLPDLIQEIGDLIHRPFVIGGFSLDLQQVYEQTSASLEGVLSSLGTQTIDILTNIAAAMVWLVFIFVASFYLVKDSAIIMRWLDEATPLVYRDDARQIRSQIAAVWNAFLRGQLNLCLVMGVVVGTTMALIGLPYAWLFGVLFGVLELIPNLGPTIAAIPAILIAFLQGSTILGLTNFWFAVLVIGLSIALQQLENSFLVPRIMGQSLNLHPVVVLVAAIIGAQMAGILGIFLAAPVVATVRILAEYAYFRLLDMPPFPRQRRQSAADLIDQPADAVDGQAKPPAQSVTAAEGKRAE